MDEKYVVEELQKLVTLAAKKVRENDLELARKYGRMALEIRKKLRMKTKLPICKCGVPLIAGVSMRCRVRQRREKHIVKTCLVCGRVRRFDLRGLRLKI